MSSKGTWSRVSVRFELLLSFCRWFQGEVNFIGGGGGGATLPKTLAAKIAWSVSILPLPPPRVISIGVKTEAIVDIRWFWRWCCTVCSWWRCCTDGRWAHHRLSIKSAAIQASCTFLQVSHVSDNHISCAKVKIRRNQCASRPLNDFRCSIQMTVRHIACFSNKNFSSLVKPYP